MSSGVYKIKNLINNKSYIGSSISIDNRIKKHKESLLKGNHHSIKLQRSYDKYGEDNFIFEIIEDVSIEYLIDREQHYINLFDSYNNGYNSVQFAGSNLGMKHSDSTKDKIRLSSIGNKNMLNKKHNDDTKNIISEKLKGRNLSDDTKLKMSEVRIGKKLSDETKLKISNLKKGKPLSEENKNKLSISHMGKKQSSEIIENRVKLNTGQKRNDEIKKKMSDNMIGIKKGPMSDENKLKRSKRILLINEDGTIKEYDGIKICADDLKITSNRISEVLNGKKKFYKGFRFKYI